MGIGIDWTTVLGPVRSGCPATDNEGLSNLEEALQLHPPRCVRLAPGVAPEDLPFATEPTPWFSRARLLTDATIRPGGFLEHALGSYYVQDAASLLPIALADIQPGETVLDACAAPGGKSTAVANELGGKGFLVSNEVIASRLAILNQALWRTGFLNYATINRDIESLSEPLSEQFDCVIVDAPCSGQSMLAKGKQTLASFSQQQVQHSAARQRRIMAAAERLVRPGGRLVYSTCTFAFAENEDVIQRFLADHPWWELPPCRDDLKAYESSQLAGCYRLWPQRDPCAGGFAAVLLKGDPPTQYDSEPNRPKKFAKKGGRTKSAQAPAEFNEWFQPPTCELRWHLVKDKVCVSTGAPPVGLESLRPNWSPLAYQKGKRLEPAYAASLARCLTPRQSVELPFDASIRYVSGLPIRESELPEATVADRIPASGWAVVTHHDQRVAWTKVSSETLKNHFPKTLRQECFKR